MHRSLQKTGGFTLIEAIIVIAIIGILAAVSLPAIGNILPNYRLKSAARSLFSHMQRARSEAVKRNTNVVIVFHRLEFMGTGGGYTVFIDDGSGGGAGAAAGDGVYTVGEPLLFHVAMPTGCILSQTSFKNDTMGYNFRGLPLGGKTGSVEMRNDNLRWYRMSLSGAGHPRIQISFDGITFN